MNTIPPKLGNNTFSNYSATLYVPKGCKTIYWLHPYWENFTKIEEIEAGYYTLTYLVDNEVYKTYTFMEGDAITPETEPIKEGYTFSGWSEIPSTMPAHDVTVSGSFTVNKYILTYLVDGDVYKSYEVEFGASITPEPSPSKEGYSFSGWSEIPSTMPAHDVTVRGSFSVNKYTLTYLVDGDVYKSFEVEYGASITPETEPSKEGYTFSGWSEIPSTMPAHDITVSGAFTQIDFVVGNVTYEVTGSDVTLLNGSNYSGDVVISTAIEINGTIYNVTAIAENAFKGNTNINSVTIPNSITQIGDGAFDGCSNLKVINIGKAVVSIGSKAFANISTTSAQSRRRAENSKIMVNCYAETIPVTSSDAFENTPIAISTLCVNDNDITLYKTTSPWNLFGSIYGFSEYTGIDSIVNDDVNKAKVFTLDGQQIQSPKKGINIVRLKNGKTMKVINK